MQHRVLGLFKSEWGQEFTQPRQLSKSIPYLYQWAIWFKANPRNETYMRQLFAEHYPEGAFVNLQEDADWRSYVPLADTIVLLYPDSIGLGFLTVEHEVDRLKKTWAGVRVLNGRRRNFLLSLGTRIGLRVRRFLEHGMVLEIFATLLFLLITPLLLVADIVRGRR